MPQFVSAMAWQDLVLSIGGFIIAAGIIPTILSPAKPPIATSTIIVTTLAVFTFTFATLGLWATVAATAAQSLLWAVVLAQSFRARSASTEAIGITEPVVTIPPLGFEEFEPPIGGDEVEPRVGVA